MAAAYFCIGGDVVTNEQLAEYIVRGDNEELKPILWDKIKGFLYNRAESFYNAHKCSCSRRGVELWDIKQAAYIAYLEALRGYKPEQGNKFLSYVKYPFKNEINKLLDIRTERGKAEPLNNAASLNKVIESDEDGDTTLEDLQADSQSLEFIDHIESALVSELIRNEVELLDEPRRSIIKMYYFEEKSLKDIAEMLNRSFEAVRQQRNNALRELKKSPELIQLYEENYKSRWDIEKTPSLKLSVIDLSVRIIKV